MKKLAFALSSFVLAASAVPAVAQSVGMPVVDAQGGAVGTVTAIDGDLLVVKTDRHEAALPRASFRAADGKLMFAMTQAQLNAEIEKSQATARAAIAAGATVKGLAGAVLGTIESVDGQNAVIKLTSGSSVSIPLTGLSGNADGTVVVGLTAEQIEKQLSPAVSSSEGQ